MFSNVMNKNFTGVHFEEKSIQEQKKEINVVNSFKRLIKSDNFCAKSLKQFEFTHNLKNLSTESKIHITNFLYKELIYLDLLEEIKYLYSRYSSQSSQSSQSSNYKKPEEFFTFKKKNLTKPQGLLIKIS